MSTKEKRNGQISNSHSKATVSNGPPVIAEEREMNNAAPREKDKMPPSELSTMSRLVLCGRQFGAKYISALDQEGLVNLVGLHRRALGTAAKAIADAAVVAARKHPFGSAIRDPRDDDFACEES